MRSILLTLILNLGLFLPTQAQTSKIQPFNAYLESIENLPEKAKFDSISRYEANMSNHARYIDSKQAIDELLKIATHLKDTILLGRTYFSYGLLARDKSNLPEALLHYEKALHFFTVTKEVKRQAKILDFIGFSYISLNDFASAEPYFKKGMVLANSIQDKDLIIQFNMELATMEDMRKNYAKALTYNSKAMKYAGNQKEEYLMIWFNRGIIYKNAGMYKESEAMYKECLAIANRKNDNYIKGYIYMNYPNTLIALNRLDEAEKYAKMALQWCEIQPERYRYEQEIYGTLTKISERKEDFKSAFQYQKKWIASNDTVNRTDKNKQLAEAETRFKTQEKEQEIIRLDEENTSKSRQFWWLFCGAGALLIMFTVALWQYRRIRQVNKELESTNALIWSRNKQISEQSDQLKNLMKELHHRVKNNLAIISSLLRLQSTRLEDEGAVKAVKEGQQRVEAMSLIHQKLYESENITKVNMKEYISDLAQGLLYAYGYKIEDFDLRVDIAEIELDVEVAVPLGLILNEIITNSFKHAFAHIDNPQLSIILNENKPFHLEIKDNGPGIDMNKWQQPTGSFGKRLIVILSEQIGAILKVNNENGTRFDLVMTV
ncbi:hypothetical protein BWI96_06705 [Siphonobacter sp. SORGH_AS_0500]|uniref:tetratricopeptide repeat-containing sensor histidine kinase n=1 Tax=Siphonobacter sp. SORGH_AS_0500 TaxID=1864824 RepID=UPI000CB4D566|nr:histidine kinase dimerization/phosphoacceptor domain -containing protein [Siphonobacter sp. SORGH_AS_0500]PKK37545.1 hypothetical protein BWI96_06705 [Siphonobacter sp. SORGH_AS_0500]